MKTLLVFAFLASSTAFAADCTVKAAETPARTVASTAASATEEECLAYTYDVAVVSKGNVRSVVAGAVTGKILQTEPRVPKPAELEKLAIR